MQLSRNNGGSSLNLAPSLSVDGFLSSNSDVNPDFFDWNVALLHTCDGGLYTGLRTFLSLCMWGDILETNHAAYYGLHELFKDQSKEQEYNGDENN